MASPQPTALPALFRAAAAVAPVAMLIADGAGRLLAANQLWLDFAGPADMTARPDTWTGVFEPESRRRVDEHLATVAAGRPAPASIDAEMATRAGRRWTRWWARREVFDRSVVMTLVVVDVHEEVAQTLDLRRLATHDHLTGLLNRRFFLETIGQAKRRSERSGRQVALLYVDLDHFKNVNDAAGHAVGDQVLARAGGRLAGAIRSADVAARLGGDEFAVLLEDVGGPEMAAVVAARVEAALEVPIEGGDRSWTVRASVGVALDGGPDESPEAWLQRADAAMYAAKRARRSTRQPVFAGAGAAPDAPPAGRAPPVPEPSKPAGDPLDQLRHLRDNLARMRQSLDALSDRLASH